MIPHDLEDPDNLEDLDYLTSRRKQANKQTQVIKKFWIRWKSKYLTSSLREFHTSSGHNQ